MNTIRAINIKQVWERFIAKHAPQSFFQAWNWGEIERGDGKKVWRIGLVNGKRQTVNSKWQTVNGKQPTANTKYNGISQIVKVRARRGTFLHVRHGPIL